MEKASPHQRVARAGGRRGCSCPWPLRGAARLRRGRGPGRREAGSLKSECELDISVRSARPCPRKQMTWPLPPLARAGGVGCCGDLEGGIPGLSPIWRLRGPIPIASDSASSSHRLKTFIFAAHVGALCSRHSGCWTSPGLTGGRPRLWSRPLEIAGGDLVGGGAGRVPVVSSPRDAWRHLPSPPPPHWTPCFLADCWFCTSLALR